MVSLPTPLLSRRLDVLDDLLHRAHAAENEADLGVVPDPLERPLRWLPPVVSLLPELLYVLRGVYGEASARDGLHDDDGEPLLRSVV